MSDILDKNGKPVERKFNDMTLDEKLEVLRIGIGALINQGNAMGVGLGRILKAMDEQESALANDEGYCDSINSEPPTERVEQTLAHPKMETPIPPVKAENSVVPE